MPERFLQTKDRARALISALETAGIRIHPSGRLRQYLRALENVVLTEDIRDPTPTEFAVLHRLLIELEDFEMISTLSHDPAVTGWVERARKAMGGGVRRTDDDNDAKARNTQFELLVAALFRAAGFAIHISEPDVRVQDSHGVFSVAVKRLRSASKLEMRIAEARDQVVRSELPGCIAIDLSCIFNPADDTVETPDLRVTQGELESAGIAFYRSIRARATSKLRQDSVFGLLFYSAQPIFDRTNRTLTYQRHWTVANTLAPTHPQTLRLREILLRLQGVVPTPS